MSKALSHSPSRSLCLSFSLSLSLSLYPSSPLPPPRLIPRLSRQSPPSLIGMLSGQRALLLRCFWISTEGQKYIKNIFIENQAKRNIHPIQLYFVVMNERKQHQKTQRQKKQCGLALFEEMSTSVRIVYLEPPSFLLSPSIESHIRSIDEACCVVYFRIDFTTQKKTQAATPMVSVTPVAR